jgi:tripartite-type tricarboxylate transporter receptor subunit TctC
LCEFNRALAPTLHTSFWKIFSKTLNKKLGIIMQITFLFSAAIGVVALGFSAVSVAQNAYPNKPIRLIVLFPAGGATDIIGRTLAQKLSAQLGQSVVVDNKPGAGGTLGSGELTKAAPDGYTLLLATTSTHSIAPSLYKNIAYSVEKDFAPISEVASATNVLIVAPNLPVKDVRELITLAKAEPDKLNYASSGNGTVVHL